MRDNLGDLSRNVKIVILLYASALISPLILIPIGIDGWGGFIISVSLLFAGGGLMIYDIWRNV